jgi:AcrR family transcriptional regulator
MPEAKARRADAEQNRSAIIEAAAQALAVDGEVSLNAIAKLAGVGNATLYRHFPTREALILEVYRREVCVLAETADELLQRHNPGQALERWVARLAQYAMTKHGLAQALRTVTASEISEDSLFAETYQPIVAALGRLLSAAEAAGVVRTGLTRTMSSLRSLACGRLIRPQTGKRGPVRCTGWFSPASRLGSACARASHVRSRTAGRPWLGGAGPS